MSPTEITRVSKWVQFVMLVLTLVKQVIENLPNMFTRVFRKGSRRKSR